MYGGGNTYTYGAGEDYGSGASLSESTEIAPPIERFICGAVWQDRNDR